MLKEFGQIARGMMFLHGHFTHPEDAADVPAVPSETRPARPVSKARPQPARRALMALCCAMPTTISNFIQIR